MNRDAAGVADVGSDKALACGAEFGEWPFSRVETLVSSALISVF
jgi:hypothetical protein